MKPHCAGESFCWTAKTQAVTSHDKGWFKSFGNEPNLLTAEGMEGVKHWSFWNVIKNVLSSKWLHDLRMVLEHLNKLCPVKTRPQNYNKLEKY